MKNKAWEYSSEIKNMPFLFLETKKTAILLSAGKSKDEIIELSKNENIYQLNKERRRTELPRTIVKRLKSVDDEGLEILANGRDEDAKIITLIAIMRTDKLFYEFMRDVYAESFSSHRLEITDSDFYVFFEDKASESERVAKWGKDNLERIRGAYRKMLCDAGLAVRDGGILKLTISDERWAVIDKALTADKECEQ